MHDCKRGLPGTRGPGTKPPMKFSPPLFRATLERRYKRFLCDVTLEDGATLTATCPNTGSMMGLKEPGIGVWLSTSDNPKRKYPNTWELVELAAETPADAPIMVGINTNHPNKLVAEAIEDGTIAELIGYDVMKKEQKYGKNSRIDILLSEPGSAATDQRNLCYVEVKNVHLLRTPGLVEFPDSVTERGTKHLGELADMVDEGHRAVMVYLVQRNDGDALRIARDIDPAYGAALDAARARGVEALAYACEITSEDIRVVRRLPLED